MSIKNYSYVDGCFVFEFESEPIVTNERHVLVPMLLTSASYFGLCFVDTNDTSVYLAKHKHLFYNGTTKVHHMSSDDFVKFGDVRDLLVNSLFQKIYQ